MEGRLTPVLGLTKPGLSSRLDARVANERVRILNGDLDILDAAIGAISGGAMSNPMTGPGDLIVGQTGGLPGRLGAGVPGQVLTVAGGGVLAWAPPTGVDLPTADGRYVRFVGGSVMTGALTPVDDFGVDLGSALRRFDTVHAAFARLRSNIAVNPPLTSSVDPFSTTVGSESFPRLAVAPNGTLRWGSGTATQDATLGRTGAAALTLTGSLATTGALTVASRAVAASPDAGNTLVWNTNGFHVPASAGGMSNPMTTPQDIIVGGTAGAPTRLGKGADTQVLTVVGGVLAWAAPASGGMSNPMTALGDVIVGGTAGAATRLAKGADGTVLTADAAAPAGVSWSAPAATASLLVNGGFEVWQRGAGPFNGNVYSADRWAQVQVGSSTISTSRDSANADVGSRYCAAIAYTHNANSAFYQAVEDYAQLRGRTVTLAVRVKVGVASAVRIGLSSDGGSTYTYSAFHAGAGTYQTLTVTAAVPTGATGLIAAVWLSASCTAYLDNASLVVGPVAVPYVPLHPADDLARCQRYYFEVGGADNYEMVCAAQATLTTRAVGVLRYPVEMAVAPTVTVSAPGDWVLYNAAASFLTCTLVTADTVSRRSCRLRAEVAAGLVVGDASTLFANATAAARIRFEANPA